MHILVLNCGGATLKYKLFLMPQERVRAEGLLDRLGTGQAFLTHRTEDGRRYEEPCPERDHLAGMRRVLELLTDPQWGVLQRLEDLDAVAHKLAHGGERFRGAVRIEEEVIKALEEYAPLVPIHNPPNLLGIRICRELLPRVPQFGTFETSFHHTVPRYAWMYPLPYEWYERYRVRKYGFHSASHRYVAQRAAEWVGRRPEELRIISCHLGSGTSVCAIRYGRSWDISSGLTPQSGTTMSTRPGDFDPFVVLYLQEQAGLSAAEIRQALIRRSGLLGLSGISGDMRDVEQAALEGNPRAQLALEVFAYSVRRFIGAFFVELGGMEVLAFTGGIGENSPRVRALIGRPLECLGLRWDEARNAALRGEEGIISAADSPIQAVVVRTNEELVVARDAYRLLLEASGKG